MSVWPVCFLFSSFCLSSIIFCVIIPVPATHGALSGSAYGGLNARNSQAIQNISLASLQPRNIFTVHALTSVNEDKISRDDADRDARTQKFQLTKVDAKKYHSHDFSLIWTQIYHFLKYSDLKLLDVPPCMCTC